MIGRALRFGLLGAFGAVAGMPLAAMAAPGEVHAVTAEKVNLRAGPSDGANVRSTVSRNDELVELRKEGEWLGVRVMRTGEEGWIFSDLVRRKTASTLSGEGAATAPQRDATAGFERLSPAFDGLVGRINDQFGYRFAERVEAGNNGTLRVVPTDAWVYNTSRDAKIYAALAVYQMWKNYNNGRPVNVVLGDGERERITIGDSGDAPELSLPAMGSSR